MAFVPWPQKRRNVLKWKFVGTLLAMLQCTYEWFQWCFAVFIRRKKFENLFQKIFTWADSFSQFPPFFWTNVVRCYAVHGNVNNNNNNIPLLRAKSSNLKLITLPLSAKVPKAIENQETHSNFHVGYRIRYLMWQTHAFFSQQGGQIQLNLPIVVLIPISEINYFYKG